MREGEYFIDDRVIIPDFIKAMTSEQLKKAISEIEAHPEKTDSIIDKLEKDYERSKFA